MKLYIPLIGSLSSYLKIFVDEIGLKIYVYFALSVLLGFLEGLGLAIMIPLFMVVYQIGDEKIAGIDKILSLLEWMNLELTASLFYIMVFVILLFRGGLTFLSLRVQNKIMASANRAIFKKILNAFYSMDYQYYINSNTGYFNNLIKNESYRAIYSITQFVVAISALIMSLIFVTLAIFSNSAFSLTVMVISALIIFSMKKVFTKTKNYSLKNASINSNFQNILIQISTSFKYLFSTGSFPKIKSQMNQVCEDSVKINYRLQMLGVKLNTFSQTTLIIVLFIFVFLFVEILKYPAVEIVITIVLCQRALAKMLNFQKTWHKFNEFAGSVKYLKKGMEEITASKEIMGEKVFDQLEKGIFINQLKYSHNEAFFLEIESFQLLKNQVVSLVGLSGSGKTSMIDVITGILKVKTGDILVDDTPLRSYDLATYRNKIGLVTQDTVLFNDTIENNITMWGEYSQEQIINACRIANCLDFIQELPEQFQTEVGERGVKLSGGQKQRITIARELLKKPEILIFDEATSALDSESEQKIQEAMKQLKGKLTLLIVAHRFSTIQFSDKVYVLDRGKIVQEGGFDELKSQESGPFKALFEKQKM